MGNIMSLFLLGLMHVSSWFQILMCYARCRAHEMGGGVVG